MTKRKRPRAAAPQAPGDLRLFPHQVRPSDRVTVNGVEWEVAAPPAVYLQGKMQTVRLRKPGQPGVTDVEHMASHERVAVRRTADEGGDST